MDTSLAGWLRPVRTAYCSQLHNYTVWLALAADRCMLAPMVALTRDTVRLNRFNPWRPTGCAARLATSSAQLDDRFTPPPARPGGSVPMAEPDAARSLSNFTFWSSLVTWGQFQWRALLTAKPPLQTGDELGKETVKFLGSTWRYQPLTDLHGGGISPARAKTGCQTVPKRAKRCQKGPWILGGRSFAAGTCE